MQERFSTFTVLIAKIGRQIRRIKSEEMGEFNLKSSHVSCLYYLHTQGAMTPAELCEICDEDKAAISRSIEHLENSGYLVSRPPAPKRYRAPLVLSESGREVAARIAEKIDGVLALVGRDMSDEERGALYEGLHRVSEDLQAVCDHYDDRTEKRKDI